jgi:DNA-binding MarR family transcriptional regulator
MAASKPGDEAPPELPQGLASLLGFQLAKCGWWLEQRTEDALEPLGLRVRHFLVLALLSTGDTLSQQEMANFLLLDPTLMVGLVDDLEAKGLCERARNPKDRRRYSVRITSQGRGVHDRARAIADEVGREVFAALDDDELRAVLGSIRRVMRPFWAERLAGPRRRPAH